ncbi:F0F1 ATP synthase subunit epsilon [Loktanella sp. IMCC34160]|uniref:F0F1 ATP synthase subunit epsilon n=1 Tax=Loktanella sp. IMCC34160 TaxID=2510646 RepID=UPI00101C2063|nr:F0F1 ATP synthase subunit epsilon [Loktanella sp. IMCC34160]RYG91968.1 F0F1 ATP synthase subunit epsilon [Loktanella sp. IMCC34160]
MAEMLQFDLVSPERKLASVQAREVQIPGADGDMTAMADHAPTITTLRPGILRVVHGSGADEYLVSGGFAEITPEGVSVLAEQALPKDEVTQDAFNGMLAGAREAHEIAKSDDSAKVVTDLQAVGSQLGLSAS